MFRGVGKNSQNPKPVLSHPWLGKTPPLPAVLVKNFPECPNLETQQWKQAPAFLKKNKPVLWDEPSAVVQDSICIGFTIHHHALQNHGFQKYSHKGTAYQILSTVANTQSITNPRSRSPHSTREIRLDSTLQ